MPKSGSQIPPDSSRSIHPNRKYVATTAASSTFNTTPSGSGAKGLELRDSSITGIVSDDSQSIAFTLTAIARADAPGASADLLQAAPPSPPAHQTKTTTSPSSDASATDPIADQEISP